MQYKLHLKKHEISKLSFLDKGGKRVLKQTSTATSPNSCYRSGEQGHFALMSVQVPPRFEDDKHVSGLFKELWEENTSGGRITLQLYLGEIVSLICNEVTASSWSSKKKSAQAMSKLCEVLRESISSYHQGK
ncbi:uncharacterized protein LOC103500260 isoform X1 [Cucumis melo]|uniref:Uncharacterized protein LOC103500260 isoform X1 n=1 Tax=Cucumis melo TaxID=3656 RepID=A0ABM3KDU4_CUCME|nr:uncharacterized protein LOC103500260 isoform X1 [Cucumis melo]XP_050935949.1 uncharacterized protein LOC103500260 isoform X1 [Cucumis melo]